MRSEPTYMPGLSEELVDPNVRALFLKRRLDGRRIYMGEDEDWANRVPFEERQRETDAL